MVVVVVMMVMVASAMMVMMVTQLDRHLSHLGRSSLGEASIIGLQYRQSVRNRV
jgi:hypothetical protein